MASTRSVQQSMTIPAALATEVQREHVIGTHPM